MNCFSCSKYCSDLSELCRHLRHLHGIPSAGCEVRCTYGGCPRVFMSFQRLKDHFASQHGDSVYVESSEVLPTTGQLNPVESDTSSCLKSVQTSSSDECKLEQSVMRFVAAIGSKPGVSQTVVQNVAEELCGLVSEVKNFAVAKTYDLCNKLDIPQDHPEVVHSISEFSKLSDFCANVDTEHKRRKWMSDNGYFIPPEEIVLGTRTEQKYSTQLRRSRQVIVEDKFQYIPIDKLLGKILEDPSAGSLIKNYQVNGMAVFPRMRDFIDTDTYKQNPFFVRHQDAFLIHLFIDAFETVNVLGSHTTIHKLEGLYCILRNVPPKYLSKTSSIFLLGLWHVLDVKRYGYEKILEPIVKCLQILETEEGLPGIVNGESVSLHGIVVACSADNLGAHSLFGYLESFSAIHPCRFCHASKIDIQQYFHENHFVLRTLSSYDDAVKNHCRQDYDASATGIKRGCLLNNLKYFHCTQQSVPDCMHDICEDVGPYELALVVQSLIDKKFVTLQFVNNRIVDFDYSLSDKNSRPPELGLPHLRLQAAESWCLLRNLPLMIGSSVPRDDPHWQLLIMLLHCMAIIFAPEVTAHQADLLSYLIEEHHVQFQLLYPSKPLLPKHHFMIHYGTQMKAFGPLICYWCMRFEAKHRFGKEVSSVCRNFKNICKSIATRTQYKLANDLLNQSLFKPLETIPVASAVVIHTLPQEVAEAICTFLRLESQDEVYVASSCQFGHYYIKPGCYVVVGVVDSQPQFGQVQLVLVLADVIYLVYKLYKTLGFDEHFFSFVIEEQSHVRVIALPSLKDQHPLAAYDIIVDGRSTRFVNTRYKIF